VSIPADWLRPDWNAAGVGALMTTRAGGCSAAPFDTMNLQFGGGDADDAVVRNRARLHDAIGATPVFVDQVHGTAVVRLTRADAEPGAPVRTADASVTTEPGIACTIQVADCLPVLFAAPDGQGVGAAHAGWRGLAGGVLEATIAALCDAAGCRPADLQAWIGAGIGQARFQVGEDVVAAFRPGGEADPGNDRSRDGPASNEGRVARFVPDAPGKWLADLPSLARDRMRAAGVRAVGGGTWCTVSEPSRFFSFRRDRVTGRMAAAVWLDYRP
jgi:YfiH family protein